ncbi:MAG TPA: TonB-dependent receptor, partial [Allosphingosinicella sp.]
DNSFRVARADAAFEMSEALTLRAGADWKRYGFDSRELRRTSETQVPALTSTQLQALTTLYSISGRTALPEGTPRTFVVPNLEAFADTLGIYSNTGMFQLFGIENATARSNFRTVTERDLGAFGQVDYNFELGSVELRGNIGARYVQTRQRSSGYTNTATTYVLTTVEREYDHILPSFNIAAELPGDIILRGAAARVMSRPDIGTLNPGGAFSVSGANRTFSRGNPNLQPIEATTVDFSAEWYFAPESALILGLFYKDISSFVSTVPEQLPFSQLGLPESLLAPYPDLTPASIFTVTQPVNGDGGIVKGLEVGLQMPFRFLEGPLDNLGMLVNYTFVDAEIEYPLTVSATPLTTRQPLIGLSRHSANATLYYEDSRFSMRGSVAYRSGYLTQVPGRNGNNSGLPTFNDVEGTHGTINVDMAASLVLTDNVTLTLEGVNLTDAYTDQYIDSRADRLSVYHHTGRQFYVGARFNF